MTEPSSFASVEESQNKKKPARDSSPYTASYDIERCLTNGLRGKSRTYSA
jgi:hypothetical protein